MHKIIISIFSFNSYSIFQLQQQLKGIQLQNENIVLRQSIRFSAEQDYNILNQKYVELKNKPADTIKISVPVDSINWIDSTRYVIKRFSCINPARHNNYKSKRFSCHYTS